MLGPPAAVIEGTFDAGTQTWSVTRDAVPVTVARSQGIARLKDEFRWGYIGSGASQLAIELMLEAGATDIEAAEYQGRFKRDVVVKWPQFKTFSITVDELTAFLTVYRTLTSLE